MPLNFPSSPTDGQIYETYQWDATKGVWVSGRYSDYRPASTDIAGIVELATDAETQTGTDAARAVTPAGLASRTATDARAGIVELATNAEAIARASTALALTPANLDAAMKDRPIQGQIPTSINIGGGSTPTVTSDGTVSFSGVTGSISLNGVMATTGPGAYRVTARVSVPGAGNAYWQIRNAGVNLTTSYNLIGNTTVFASGPGRIALFPTTTLGWLKYNSGNADSAWGYVDIIRQDGNFSALATAWNTEVGDRRHITTGCEFPSTGADGVSLILGASTSGWIKVVRIA